jgi:3-hydroxy-9,10-secoandrosta-1,3,5(10)-triene-9,17-dione monooxygenase reductase component
MATTVPLSPTPTVMRQALRSLVTGVTVVTFRDERGEPAGMTASAVCSVSLEPPQVLACVNKASRSFAAIEAARRFGVSVLNEGQREIAEYCARPAADKRLDARWIDHRLSAEAPSAIAGALCHLDCTVSASVDASTHAIVVGRVQAILIGDDAGPLTYFRGAYRQLDPDPEHRVEALWDLLARHGY